MQYSVTEFESLYTQCFPPSMRLAMSLLHEEDEARDIVQETFLRLWQLNIHIENPMAFIIRSVRNACLNRINMLDTRQKIHRQLTLEPPAEDFDPHQHDEEVMMAIHSLLSEREQQVVEHIFSYGMSYKETAENLNVSIATVNKNIVTALKKLRTHFKTGKS